MWQILPLVPAQPGLPAITLDLNARAAQNIRPDDKERV
jgi:hypothetical protein